MKSIIITSSQYLKNLKKHKKPIQYLLARFLVRTRLCKLFKIKTNGYLLHYYPTAISSELWQNPFGRQYEMLPHIKKGFIVVDIGANIGTTVIPSALAVGETGKVIAFEAHPKTFQYLKSNVKLNGLTNVSLFNIALGEKQGNIIITDKEEDDQNTITNDSSGTSIKVATLDDYTSDYEEINLLKIDVEGFELFVLKGAEKTLNKTQSIYIEISEVHFNNFGYSCSDVLKLLEENNFKCFKLKNGECTEEITTKYIQKELYENIIAKRSFD